MFLPFIKLLRERTEEVRLDARTDFRLEKLAGERVWHVPADKAARQALDGAFARLTGGAAPIPTTLLVLGHEVIVPRQAQGVARFDFAELCGRPLGASDYIALARRFHTFVIDAIPVMEERRRNEVKRFIALIDTLYERHVKLVASAEAEPEGFIRRKRPGSARIQAHRVAPDGDALAGLSRPAARPRRIRAPAARRPVLSRRDDRSHGVGGVESLERRR